MTNFINDIGVQTIVAGVFYVALKVHDLKALRETSDVIKFNVKVISDHLIQADPKFNHTELKTYSPLRLSTAGQELIEKLGFDDVFGMNRQDFFGCIDSSKPKQKYDVEKAAIKSVIVLSDEDYMGFLKTFFYNNPQRSMRDTAPTLGIYIRDAYLREHPDILE